MTGGYTGQVGGTYHGKGGTIVQFDGMGIQHSQGNQGYNQNQETVQETVLSTSGISADTNADGVAAQPGSQGGRQHLLGRRERALFRQQHAERQPDRRAARPRPHDRDPCPLRL